MRVGGVKVTVSRLCFWLSEWFLPPPSPCCPEADGLREFGRQSKRRSGSTGLLKSKVNLLNYFILIDFLEPNNKYQKPFEYLKGDMHKEQDSYEEVANFYKFKTNMKDVFPVLVKVQ